MNPIQRANESELRMTYQEMGAFGDPETPKPRPVVKRQNIGPAIRKMRIEQGLTLDDLSEQAGLSASHLSRIERNQTLPSFTVLAGIARVLDVSIDHFAKLEQDISVRDAQLKAALRVELWSDDEIEAALEADEYVKQALHRTFVHPVSRG